MVQILRVNRLFFSLFSCNFIVSLKTSTNHQQICSSFSWAQPTLQKQLQIPTWLITLASTVTMFVNSVHICLCQKEKKSFENKQKGEKPCLQGCLLFIWLFIEENCSKCGDCFNMQVTHAVTSYRRLLLFFVIMLNYRILIVQEENDTVS